MINEYRFSPSHWWNGSGPDGGWNCDKREEAHHSSFNESLSTLWGLTEYYHATHDKDVWKTIDHVDEFFLRHNLFRSERPVRLFMRV